AADGKANEPETHHKNVIGKERIKPITFTSEFSSMDGTCLLESLMGSELNNNNVNNIENDVIESPNGGADAAKTADENVKGTIGQSVMSRVEDGGMKVRRGMKYASLIGYNHDIKRGRNENIRPKAQSLVMEKQ
ncbi:23497_t:CDS:2, partial [Gigaspora rosea]